MREIGIDISGHATKSVAQLNAAKQPFDHVVTVCDEANAERCPAVPGAAPRLHLGFPDPSALPGTHDDKLIGTRRIRDDIRTAISTLAKRLATSSPSPRI